MESCSCHNAETRTTSGLLDNLAHVRVVVVQHTTVLSKRDRRIPLGHSIKDYVQDPSDEDVFVKVIDDHLTWFQSHSN